MILTFCALCSIKIYKKPSQVKKAKRSFCSAKCSTTYNNLNRYGCDDILRELIHRFENLEHKPIKEKLSQFSKNKYETDVSGNWYVIQCTKCPKKVSSTTPYKKKFCGECKIKRLREVGYTNLAVKRSKNEIYFAELCKTKFNNVLENECLFDGWDADVILPDLKIAILWNGIWHYEKVRENHSVKQVQSRDKIKLHKIENAGYKAYIIKDMGKHNKKFVEAEFEKFLSTFSSRT